jgi:hypothetical protein
MKLDDALTANEIVIERQKAKSRPKVDSKSKGS